MMMLSPEQHYHFMNNNNSLLSHKSSFQAWKCVSFGCSLLVMILLLSKYYEVNSDLKLLRGIDSLLLAQEASNGTLTWPPVAIDMVLPASNESNFGMESLESNGTMLMSHMHMSLSREQTGNQLLRQEVGAFVAEFKAAKSTLGLSSLLVVIYIVSWILMTLAINDTRISNDISLRNILLLSVFGAIDVAASIGFVMVRVIMFSVKNSSFAIEILGSSGLRDTPVKLGADQLTAFTALRLIAMRSCTAYTDLYVSTLIALLTILRLYAIVRAITYYRKLRRSSERGQPVGLVGSEHKSIWSSAGLYNHPPGATHLFAAHHHHLISTPPSRQQLQQPTKLQQLPERAGSPGSLMMDPNPNHHYHPQSATLERSPFQLTSHYGPTQAHGHHDQLLYNQQQQQQQHSGPLDAPKSTFRTTYQSSGSVPPPSKLMFSSPTQLTKQSPAPPPPPPTPPLSPPFNKSFTTKQQPSVAAAAAAACGKSKLKTTNNRLITPSQSQQPQFILRHSSAATLNRLPTPKQRTKNLRYTTTSANPILNPNLSAPNLLFMTGAKASSYLGLPMDSIHNARDDETGDQCESDPPRRRKRTPVQFSGDTGSDRLRSLRLQGATKDKTLMMNNGETEDEEVDLAAVLDEQSGGELLHRLDSSQQQDMLSPRGRDPETRRHSSQTLGTAYRLLNPNKLDKIGLRLLQAASGSGSKRAAANTSSSSRYKHANRYKQILVPHTLETPKLSKFASSQPRLAVTTSPGQSFAQAERHRQAAARNSSATSGSSSSLEEDEDESDRSRTHRERRRRRAERHQSASLPLREEFVTEATVGGGGDNGDLAATRLFELEGGNGQSFLLEKCKYYQSFSIISVA